MSDLSHQPCPHPECSSSNAFSYSPSKMVGVCFSCSNSYPKRGVKYSAEALEAYPLGDLAQEDDYTPPAPSQGSYVALRGITKETMEFFDVKTVVSPSGEPQSQTYVYPSGATKTRLFPKNFRASGRMDCLFGQNLFTAGVSKMVTITEGEIDAMSAWQALGGASSRYPNPVVSLPSASPSKDFWQNVVPWLDTFEKIVLSVDTDGAGNDVAKKINSLFPEKTLSGGPQHPQGCKRLPASW